ncbi:glycosyltransferase [Proteus mirabilis]|uniref:glycosyltransferase n=1 Tax=Proteus mirabilis TaxID=584 RepID=UPI00197D53CB|nr:glycosyltransferase [Proteus mirabilis]QSI20399.1 glycosyltransferase [Proteus mirabilis]QUY06543.1 glycosyltransferase [Proteus mirabilis]
MNNFKKVSIVITSFNRGVLLERAIESAISQTYQNIEIIIVDDCSSDTKTIEILKKFDNKNKYSNIKIFILEKNKGANYCRNVGINKSTGYFYTGLDDDDYFSKDRVQFLIDNYHDKYGFICTNYLLVNGKKNKKRFIGPKTLKKNSLFKINNAGNQIFTTIDKIKSVNCFDTNLKRLQDQDMWIRLLKKYKIAKRFNKANYIMDIDHCFNRITKNNNEFQSYYTLYRKHKSEMDLSSRRYNMLRLIYLKKSKIPFKYFSLSPIYFFKITLKTKLKR